MQNVMGVLFIRDGGSLRIKSDDWTQCLVATGFREAVKAAFYNHGMELMDFDGAMAQPGQDGHTTLSVWSKRHRREVGG